MESNKYLYDTNIFIYHLNGESLIKRYFDENFLRSNEVVYSIINEIELLSYPELTKDDIDKNKSLLSNFNKKTLTEEIKDQTIDLRKQNNIRIGDAIIAGTALNQNSVLVTRNEKDFNKISNLKIINPFKVN